MGWIAVVAGIVLLLLSLLVNPKWWRATSAWQYRTPEAVEPSDAAYRARRGGVAAAGLLLMLAGAALNSGLTGNSLGRSDSRPAVDKLAHLLGTGVFGPSEVGTIGDSHPPMKDFQATLQDYVTSYAEQVSRTDYPGAKLSVTGASASGTTHLFTIAAADKHSYCLRLNEAGPGVAKISNSIKGVPPTVSGYDVPITAKVTDSACGAL